MKSFNTLSNVTGWLMFAVAATVYMLTAEPTSSLWDCGEFISAAYKLEVVHPPGAPLFLMIGRMFAWVATLISDDPSTIAYALNVMSGLCTALLVMFVCWTTIMLAKLAMVGRYGEPEEGGETIAILASGVVAGLATTFATSVWFSAVEGEVYAMSSGFTGLVMWASMKWYTLDNAKADRWLIFIAYMMGLSIGVHLLSLLAFPFLGVLYYFKKKELVDEDVTFSIMGVIKGFIGGFVGLAAVQYFIIPRLPQMAAAVDYFFVNGVGMGLGTGVLFFVLALCAGIVAALRYAHQKQNYELHLVVMMFSMILAGFSSYGMVVIRANAQTAINMNNPSDPYSMLSYLNREQYGDRPLLYGPHFASERSGIYPEGKEVYRPIEQADGSYIYDVVDQKQEVGYLPSDMMLFPRLGHVDRRNEYMKWFDLGPSGKPTMGQNLGFFFRYQIGYMYIRYFAWNFIGRQNALQGVAPEATRGNWLSGVGPIDAMRLHTQSNLPSYITEDKARNTYFFLPFIFGMIGLLFHIKRRPREAAATGVMFLMTGLAIIVFTNQPPREPRERDYVIVGSIFTFCMWMGLSVPYIYERLKDKMPGMASALLAATIVIVAPIIMGQQNWDDHSRANQYGARDYAVNFLESCDSNAIIFTYGDNDTYPLWYAQEVENIRPDVRVINFSLLAVDWYIDHLRRKINKSPRVKMSIPKAAYRGKLRNYLPFQIKKGEQYINLVDVVNYIGSTPKDLDPRMAENFASYVPARNVYLPVDPVKARANGAIPRSIPDSMIIQNMKFKLKDGQFMMKDEIALMDIIATNAANGWERPIYFAVTCRAEKIMGLRDYLNLEGMALRIVPYYTQSATPNTIMMGRVDTELMYENMVGTEEHPSEFKWGNFDKQDFFINESYMPSVHSLQYGLRRLAEALITKGPEYKEKTVKTVDKFFQVFPNFNFPYDQSQMSLVMMRMYFLLEEEEKGQKEMTILADALEERMTFYAGLVSSADIQTFDQDKRITLGMIQGTLQVVGASKDEAFKKKIMDQLGHFMPQQVQ